jgi:hypothetical protein
MRKRGTDGPHRTHEVRLERPLPIGVAGLDEAAEVQSPGADVVDHEVDGTMRLDRGLHERRRTFLGREIDSHGRHPLAFQIFWLASACHDIGAFGDELFDDRAPDAAARTAHHRDVVGQAQVHAAPMLRASPSIRVAKPCRRCRR